MKKLKNVIYWITLIKPIYDLIQGTIRGIKLGIEDIKKQKIKQKHALNQQAFNKSNTDHDYKLL